MVEGLLVGRNLLCRYYLEFVNLSVAMHYWGCLVQTSLIDLCS